ncbi:MAG: hypothetical protein KBD46_00220 [Candidatus Levybacteria bacterium]|nr:hypothetical protein [Candidatus Levybacteria bacterium]
MFYGFTESESFEDPTILNNYTHHKVIVEKRADGMGFWHIFILKIKDEQIDDVVEMISKNLKPDWNAMFYNKNILYAVFKGKIFTLQMKNNWNLKDYEEVKKYAKNADVGDLDMNEVFAHYNQLLRK